MAEHLAPASTRWEGLPHRVGSGKDDLLTHYLTFLTENLSAHAEHVPECRSIHMTMLIHDVATAYAAETSAELLRACNQSFTKYQHVAGQSHRSLSATGIQSEATRFLTNDNPIRQRLQDDGVTPVIPPKSNRNEPIDYDAEQYKQRQKVERFFNKLKQFRRIATRYEKLEQTFLALIHLVSAWIMVK